MEGTVRAHVIVDGVVQGVFFRASTAETARGIGVSGWVRNLDDGRVEAVFEGPEEHVRRVIEWTWQGPPRAVVEDVQVTWEEPEGETGFVSVH